MNLGSLCDRSRIANCTFTRKVITSHFYTFFIHVILFRCTVKGFQCHSVGLLQECVTKGGKIYQYKMESN